MDSFHGYNKQELLDDFRKDTYKAIENRISLNPILNSFQHAVHANKIERGHIDSFLKSMEMDLIRNQYDQQAYEQYIMGSAEVVGLMCLRVFVEGNDRLYEELKPYAMKMGSALQKINFLRDFKDDKDGLGRMYFPQLRFKPFDEETKKEIETDILHDFNMGYEGIKRLPKDARFGVYVTYIYYSQLLHKIMQLPAQTIMQERIRISTNQKYALFFGSYFRHSFDLL